MKINNNKILEEVTKVSIALLLKEPFYAHLFSCINKKVVEGDKTVKTLGVGLSGGAHSLYVNAEFWDKQLVNSNYRYGVLKHEVLHIVFKHTLESTVNYDKHLINIAMDLVVNQFVSRLLLPDESIFLETFPDLKLEANQTWQYYYNKLLSLKNGFEKEFKGSVSAQNFKSINSSSHGLNRHEKWVEISSLSNIEKSILEAQVENLINIAQQRTSVRHYNNLPAGLRLWIEGIVNKPFPLVDWRRVIKLFSESSCKTKIKTTLKRPSKRFGTVPGIKVLKLRKLLIAVDTSGSISKEDLSDFFSEIFHIWRQGAEIEIIECDTEITAKYHYRGDIPKFVKGGGGTDFNAPIIYGNEELHPDGLIYFTDGYADKPNVYPRFPLLWVICSNGLPSESDSFKNLPGRKAKLHT